MDSARHRDGGDTGAFSLPAGLYGIVEPALGDPLEQARLLAGEGVGTVQLRCKGWEEARLLGLALRCRELGVVVIVNDACGVARAAGLPVHLGQGDGPDPDLPFGRSTHTPEQASVPGRAAYIGFGPVFGTASKDSSYTPRGVAMLAEAVRRSPVPVVAIGGITPQNLPAVRDAGARAWAVIGALWRSADVRAAVRALR